MRLVTVGVSRDSITDTSSKVLNFIVKPIAIAVGFLNNNYYFVKNLSKNLETTNKFIIFVSRKLKTNRIYD